MSRYATDYGPDGLQVFWLDENEQQHPLELTLTGSSVSPYSSSGELTRTYAFTMPEHDVHVTADFVKIGHRISTAAVDVPGQTLRGRFFQGETNLSVSPNEQRAVAGDTITAEFHVDHEENMGSYGIRSAWITWEENGATQQRDLENVRYDEYLRFYGDFVMPDADVVLHAELERSWWVVTDHYSGFSLDPDKWEAFVGETVTVTANLFDEGSETFEGWTWHVVTYDENSQPVDVGFTLDSSAPNRISFRMPDGPVSVSIESPYSYISRRWTGSRVEEDVKNPVEFTLISSLQDNENLTLTSGVWILSQSRSFSNRLTISGDVHLVLCDGATLTCGKGIELAPGNSLSVYGQEEDTGKLICTGPENHAGIGGGNNTGSGNFTIHGGTVTANGGDYAAGVGTGDEASPDSCGSFTMLGGSLTNLNGDVFFVNNTRAVINLTGVEIVNDDPEGVFLRAAAAGWGREGTNGGHAELCTAAQTINGDLLADKLSSLELHLADGSVLTGAVNPADEGAVSVSLTDGAKWTLTGDSFVESLHCEADSIQLNGFRLLVNGVPYTQGTAMD
jgi:hypothetical protein